MNQALKISLLLLAVVTQALADPLNFHFPEDFSWKAVFDRGFRPKHITGLQHRNSECIDQEIRFHYGDHRFFTLDRGRLMFEVQIDDSLRVIEHTSRVSITMEEGERRLNTFRKMFDGHIVQPGTMPPTVGPAHNRVMTTSDQHAVAEVNGYRIFFGFNSAMTRTPRLLPVFAMILKGTTKGAQLPIRRKTVEPPPGYEWYSMDPKVHTPDPGSEATATSPTAQNPPRNINGMSSEDDSAKTGLNVKRTLLSIATAAACFIALLVWIVWRSFKKSNSEG